MIACEFPIPSAEIGTDWNATLWSGLWPSLIGAAVVIFVFWGTIRQDRRRMLTQRGVDADVEARRTRLNAFVRLIDEYQQTLADYKVAYRASDNSALAGYTPFMERCCDAIRVFGAQILFDDQPVGAWLSHQGNGIGDVVPSTEETAQLYVDEITRLVGWISRWAVDPTVGLPAPVVSPESE